MGKTDTRVSATQRCVIRGDPLWKPGGDGISEGPIFAVGMQRWRVRLQCPISLTSASPCVSLLLAAAGGNVGHTRCRLKIVNHLDRERDVIVHASRDFSDRAASGMARSSMGNRAAIEVSKLRSPSHGYLQDGLLQIEIKVWQQMTGAVATEAAVAASAASVQDARSMRRLNDRATAAAKGRIRRRTRSRATGSVALAQAVGDVVGMTFDDADDARMMQTIHDRRRRRRARHLGPTHRLSAATDSFQGVVGALDGDTALCSLFAGARIAGVSADSKAVGNGNTQR